MLLLRVFPAGNTEIKQLCVGEFTFFTSGFTWVVQSQQAGSFLEVTGELRSLFIIERRFFQYLPLFWAPLSAASASPPPATYPPNS